MLPYPIEACPYNIDPNSLGAPTKRLRRSQLYDLISDPTANSKYGWIRKNQGYALTLIAQAPTTLKTGLQVEDAEPSMS